METITAIRQRISSRDFVKNKKLSTAQLHELVDCALQAPSAYNLQHTRFLAVSDAAAKATLKDIANGQQKVVDASVVFVVLADLKAHVKHANMAKRGVDSGIYDVAIAEQMLAKANIDYNNNMQFARDEAIRSASLAAMNLMTAATAMGLSTCPMGGFSREKLRATFDINHDYVAVMLLAVGYAASKQQKKPRFRTEEVLIMDARPNRQYGLR